jgi:hypothetical protein
MPSKPKHVGSWSEIERGPRVTIDTCADILFLDYMAGCVFGFSASVESSSKNLKDGVAREIWNLGDFCGHSSGELKRL